MKDYEKWDQHVPTKVNWINNNYDHPSRKHFVDYVNSRYGQINSIVEIGGGELIEGRMILQNNPDIYYSAVDVSDSFLKSCQSYECFNCIQGSMTDLSILDKKYDLLYAANVLEHSPDIIKTIENFHSNSREFYFIMFKWLVSGGDLTSNYKHRKSYFSSRFNLDMLIDLISKYGKINDMFFINKNTGETISYLEARKVDKELYSNIKNGRRAGHRLIIQGVWKD